MTTEAETAKSMPTFGEGLALGLVIAAVVALFVIALIPGGRPANPSFYETAAQVIPVLLLALIVEHMWRPGIPLLLTILGCLVVGEIMAMIGTAYDFPRKLHTDQYVVLKARGLTDVVEFFVVVALGVGLSAVLWGTVFRHRTPAQNADST